MILVCFVAYMGGSIIGDILQTTDKEFTIKEYVWFNGGNGYAWWVDTTDGNRYMLPLFGSDEFKDLYHPGDTITCSITHSNIQKVKSRK